MMSKIGLKKELLERKIGGKKQNRLNPSNFMPAELLIGCSDSS